jgi:hypothetical protein
LEQAWSLELGAVGAGPTQDPGKHFLKITMFIFFTQVGVLLQRYSSAPRSEAATRLHATALQRGYMRSVSCCSALWSYCSAAPWLGSMLRPLHEEGDDNCLLLLAALSPSSFGCFVSKNSFPFFFWLLWSCVAAQLHEEGNSNCIADFIFSLLFLV